MDISENSRDSKELGTKSNAIDLEGPASTGTHEHTGK